MTDRQFGARQAGVEGTPTTSVRSRPPSGTLRGVDATKPRSVFFAYASQPASCGEAMATAAASLEEKGTPSLTWQNLQPGGRILIDTITEAIDGSDVVVAEISSMNRNVLFEAGYALAKNKGLLFAMDESLESARRLWEGVQLFTTVGRLDYHGNGSELAELVSANLTAAVTSESL